MGSQSLMVRDTGAFLSSPSARRAASHRERKSASQENRARLLELKSSTLGEAMKKTLAILTAIVMPGGFVVLAVAVSAFLFARHRARLAATVAAGA